MDGGGFPTPTVRAGRSTTVPARAVPHRCVPAVTPDVKERPVSVSDLSPASDELAEFDSGARFGERHCDGVSVAEFVRDCTCGAGHGGGEHHESCGWLVLGDVDESVGEPPASADDEETFPVDPARPARPVADLEVAAVAA